MPRVVRRQLGNSTQHKTEDLRVKIQRHGIRSRTRKTIERIYKYHQQQVDHSELFERFRIDGRAVNLQTTSLRV